MKVGTTSRFEQMAWVETLFRFGGTGFFVGRDFREAEIPPIFMIFYARLMI